MAATASYIVLTRGFEKLAAPVDVFIPVAIAGAAVLAALAVAALSYMRAVNGLVTFIRGKEPSRGDLRRYPGSSNPALLMFWISRVVLGTQTFVIPDDDYRALLRMARRRLLVCLVLFVILLVGLGWFTRAR
jgi:hypothetical protein